MVNGQSSMVSVWLFTYYLIPMPDAPASCKNLIPYASRLLPHSPKYST